MMSTWSRRATSSPITGDGWATCHQAGRSLLEWLDRRITRRLADDRPIMHKAPGSPDANGER